MAHGVREHRDTGEKGKYGAGETRNAQHVSVSHIGLLADKKDNRYTTMLLYVIQNTLAD